MTLNAVIFTIIAAFIISLIFYYGFRASGPWGSFWTFYLILLLAGVSVAPWVKPVGPTIAKVPWIPVTFIIVIFAILLAAASPRVYVSKTEDAIKKGDTKTPDESVGSTAVALGIFFWLLLLFFLIAIFAAL